jgi:hypothetical protein
MGFFRLIEKKVFGVNDRADSIFVSHGPSPARMEVCHQMGMDEQRSQGKVTDLKPDPIADGANLVIMGCHTGKGHEAFTKGYMDAGGPKFK